MGLVSCGATCALHFALCIRSINSKSLSLSCACYLFAAQSLVRAIDATVAAKGLWKKVSQVFTNAEHGIVTLLERHPAYTLLSLLAIQIL
jgi:hypothetical protein